MFFLKTFFFLQFVQQKMEERFFRTLLNAKKLEKPFLHLLLNKLEKKNVFKRKNFFYFSGNSLTVFPTVLPTVLPTLFPKKSFNKTLKKSKGKLHCGSKLFFLSPISQPIIELRSSYLQTVTTYIETIQK